MPRSADVPLWTSRVATLAMASAWSVISFSVAINALAKSNRDKARVRQLAPPGAQVNIVDDDVFQSGAVITAVSILIFVVTALSLFMLLVRPTSFARSRIITTQASILTFCAVWFFAVLVPFTHFVRTRSAAVRATINGLSIPDSIISSMEQRLGLSSVYRNLSYLRLVAILSWLALLFTIIATIVLWMAASRASDSPKPVQETPAADTAHDDSTEEKDKQGAESPTV